MSSVVVATTHYHASFTLKQRKREEGGWDVLLKVIREWVATRVQKIGGRRPQFGDGFRNGDFWKAPESPGTTARTAAASPDLATRTWRCWALRFEHPDREVDGRIWRTDVGIMIRAADTFDVAITNGHFMRPGFLGEAPPAASQSAPRLVSDLLGSRFWFPSAGSEPLALDPISVRVGDGPHLESRLKDSARDCPIVLVSRFSSGGLPLDTRELAKRIAGAANVYEIAEPAVELELDWFLPEKFRCFAGAVRVYQPRVEFESPGDSRRHRFLKGHSMSRDVILETIVRGICQFPMTHGPAQIRTLEDITQIERESRLAELKRTAAYGSKEWVQLLEDENRRLEQKVKQLEEQSLGIGVELETVKEELEDARQESDRLRYEKDQVLASSRNRDGRETSTQFDLEELPDTLSEVIELIERLYPGRILFTERARKAAADATFRRIRIAWKVLRAMATVLYELHIDAGLPLFEIKKQFREKTGFELAIGESEATRTHRRLGPLRQLRYNGQDLDISTHVKYGTSAPDCLRVHYHPLIEEKRLIIGHCGDHLDTTRTN
jgi:hypothetical protein